MRTCPRDQTATRADLADPLVGVVLGDRYRVLERIGAGGMGQVYRAAHVRIASVFAVKVLYGDLAADTQMRTRFEREAEVASLLQSRYIVRIADFGESASGQLYLAMEFLDGHSLADRVARDGALGPVVSISILRQIARGLAHAHERGVVHRDLKSDNVMLVSEDDEPDVVRLLDFGLARLRTGTRLTRAGQVFGTPMYMAPEQFGDADVDARADLYALGVIAYEMLAGVVPFESDSVMDIARLHLTEPPMPIRTKRPNTNVPADFERIVLKLLEKKPEDRFQSARAVLDALRMLRVDVEPLKPRAAPSLPAATSSGVPAEALQAIHQAIVIGAPTYNQGDHAGCYEIYRQTAVDLLESTLALESHTAAAVRLTLAVDRAAAYESPTDAAWEMRSGFDDLVHAASARPGARALSWFSREIAVATAIASQRYAAGDLDLLAVFYMAFVEQLARRARRVNAAAHVADALETALVRARAETERPRVVATLSEALEAIASDRSLPVVPGAATAFSVVSCTRLDEVNSRIVQAISVGAPAYNAGDVAGCLRIYRHTAEAIIALLGNEAACAPVVARLQRALEESASADVSTAAWTMRHAFDALLSGSAN
jgi:hypothetical protein